MREEAEKRIGHLYPKVEVSEEMIAERPDLERYKGRKLAVIAWLWARTVKSPNPAFADVEVPLASTFMLSTKKGKEAYVEPVIEGRGYRFSIKVGMPQEPEKARLGTTAGKRHAFQCLMSGVPVTYDHIRAEGKAGRMRARLMAIVAEGERGRVYLAPTTEHDAVARQARPDWRPDIDLPANPRDFKTPNYGLAAFSDLFTPRQLVALTTFSDLATEARALVERDAIVAGLPDDSTPLRDGGTAATAYAEAVGVYLAFAVSKMTNIGSSIASWMSDRGAFRETFARQAIPMTWDYAEPNFLATATGSIDAAIACAVDPLVPMSTRAIGASSQAAASGQEKSSGRVVSTDPPYYDNIGYADLSDFFYVWLRRSLRSSLSLTSSPRSPFLRPKNWSRRPYRHGNKKKAEAFFLAGMTDAMRRLAEQAHSGLPGHDLLRLQASPRKKGTDGHFQHRLGDLPGCRDQGRLLGISGTWPMRTEGLVIV